MSSKVMEDIKAGRGLKPLGQLELPNASKAHKLSDLRNNYKLNKLEQDFRRQIKEEITFSIDQGKFQVTILIPDKLVTNIRIDNIIKELQGSGYTVTMTAKSIFEEVLKIKW